MKPCLASFIRFYSFALYPRGVTECIDGTSISGVSEGSRRSVQLRSVLKKIVREFHRQ